MGQASKLRRKGDLAQAGRLYLTILEAYPGNQRASKALEQLRAEAIDPPVETLRDLESLYQKGEFAGVAETGERFAQDFPRSCTLWNIIGAANQALGRTQAAEENFRRALDINPQDADAHNNLGVILKAQNRTGEALESYQRATLFNPNHADALVNLGNLVKDTGHVDDALTYYAKAQRIKGMSRSLLNFVERRCRVERYAALEAGAMNF
ncbi:tetratricopeptide repeat protein, partial [Aurantimonas sp. C2-5-R2]|uniref:tetratricopeptide repeat protein n=1 Tax=Aurantimonas sp. C2-5-R2 TaxID=3113713 RepID=UPI002F945F43